jgi:hypothetical protein
MPGDEGDDQVAATLHQILDQIVALTNRIDGLEKNPEKLPWKDDTAILA